MTPDKMTKFKEAAQCRALTVFSSALEGSTKRIDSDHYVEGYAARYEPYVLWEDENGPVYERFERGCFDNCDMSDIIMQYDHSGKVMARTGNGTLLVEVDENGLFTAADLSRTEAARDLFTDIKEGMVTKMSWRFRTGNYYYDKDTRTIVHLTVKKIYDVSAVSIPANDNTEINARSWVDGVIDLAARSEAELEERRRKLRLKIKTKQGGSHNET
jgi:HK97 family phage prohead protease